MPPLLRCSKAAIVAGILCLLMLVITPTLVPHYRTPRATRWVPRASFRTQKAVCNADMPKGFGPHVSEPHTDDAPGFLAFPGFAATAEASTAANGYTLAAKNVHKTVGTKTAGDSLGWVNLVAYDPQACAAECDSRSDCKAFNIYYQRSPAVAPGISDARPDTPAMTNIVCLLYSNRLKKKDLTKDGELCGQFQVVVAGSNVFNKIQKKTTEIFPTVTLPR